MVARWAWVLVAVAFVTAASRPARAQEGSRLVWQQEWDAIEAGEYAAIGLLGFGALWSELKLAPTEPHPRGGVLFDDAVRTALRRPERAGRKRAAAASDVLLGGLLLYSPVVDAALVAGAGDRNWPVARRLLAIDALSYVASAALLSLTKNVVARERPFGRQCSPQPGDESPCGEADRYKGFPSGHSALAFTAASLICIHHRRLPLYEKGAVDDATCGVALAGAATTGLLRILADKHYLSDVLTGAVVGFLSGFVLPAALHYGFEPGRVPAGD